MPIQRRAILRPVRELERLAAELEADEPVRLAGIAKVQILLSDGTSPLFTALPDGALDDAVAHAWPRCSWTEPWTSWRSSSGSSSSRSMFLLIEGLDRV